MEKGSFIHTIQIRHNNKDKTQYWFSGGIAAVDIDMEDGISHVKVTGISRSHQMDVERRSRSFQNKQTTYSSLIEQLAKSYSQGAARNEATHPSAVIGELVVQYQETDWQFMKRLASRVGTMILPDITMDAPRIYFGVPDFSWGEKMEAYYYRYVNDHAKYLDYAAHTEESTSAIHPTDVAHYEVKSNNYHEVGSNVTFKGKSWVVTSAQITYEQGMLSYQHVLVDRSAFQRKSKMNQRIQGVSLEGKVVQRANNMVQVHLDIDNGFDEQSNWWFPYSPDGNNMVHAMPEEGARIKVYFPNGTEKGAMAVNSSRGKHEEMKGRTVFQKPSTKVFHMPGAAKMELGEDGVLFEKNTVRMRLDQANILVESDGVLYVHAENTMEMGNSNSMSKRIRMSAVEYIQFQTQSGNSAMKIWDNQVGIQSDKVNFHKVEMSLLDMLNEEDLKEMYIDSEASIEEMNLLSTKTYGFTHPGSISDKESAGIREGVRERVGKDPNASAKARARVEEWKPDLIEQRHKEYLYRTRKEEAQRAEQQSGTGTVVLGAAAAQSQSSGHQESVGSQGSTSRYISSKVSKAGNYLGKLMDMSRAGIEGKSGLENLAGAILNDMQLQKELSAKPDYYTKQLDDGGKYYARYTFLQFQVAPLMFWSDLQIAAGLLGLVLAPFSLGGSLTLTVLAVADIGLSVADIVIASKKKNDLMEGKLETDPTFLGMNQSVVNILGLASFAATIGVSLWKAANVGADARRVKALVEMDRIEDAKRLEQAAIRKRVEGNIAESEAVREARKSSGWKDYVNGLPSKGNKVYYIDSVKNLKNSADSDILKLLEKNEIFKFRNGDEIKSSDIRKLLTTTNNSDKSGIRNFTPLEAFNEARIRKLYKNETSYKEIIASSSETFKNNVEKVLTRKQKRGGNIGRAEIKIEGVQSEMNAFSKWQSAEDINLNTIEREKFIRDNNLVFETNSRSPLETLDDSIKRPGSKDTEAKILEEIRKQLGSRNNAKGTIELFTEKSVCSSCQHVIFQFLEDFPNININIYYNNPL
nr:deaminase domain-containing protein [Paenibacillus turicensis]